MAALGRILQIVGWLWLAIGFLGPRLDIPGLDGLASFGVFPGIIMLFIARLIRRQARSQMPELPGNESARPPVPQPAKPEPEPTPPERPLNTDRQRPTPPPVEPVPEPEPLAEVKEHNEILEKILAANEGTAKPPTTTRTTPTQRDKVPTMTSDEMVAQARRRWDRKP